MMIKMIENKKIFEETNYTLLTTDLTDTCDLVPTLVLNEINAGPTWRFVFRNAVEEIEDLVGVSGDALCIAYTTRSGGFTARTISEATLDSTGYIKDKMTLYQIEITIGDIVYMATRISDVVQEDAVGLPLVRVSLQKMVQAISYKIDCDIRDLLVGCVDAGTNVASAATLGTLSYDDVVDAIAVLKNNGYWAEDGSYLLFVNASQEADLVKDTRFTDTARYSYANIPLGAAGGAGFNMPERGRYASCRVFVTDIPMAWGAVAYALVVVPPSNAGGPAAVMAWKRHLKTETWRDEQYGRDLWSLSTRYGLSCKFADAIYLISNC